MRQTTYTDQDGLTYTVELPDGVEDSEAARGILIGPPDVRDLNLSDALAKRLHNQLVARGLFTYTDVLKRGGMNAILAAWQAALRIDAAEIMKLYTRENG